MPPSPARRFIEARLAAQGTTQAHSGPGAPPRGEQGQAGQEYRLLLAALGEDLRRLKQLQSVERKIEAKRGMIARYADWVRGALAAEHPVQDEIVATMLIWCLDLGEWHEARVLAAHVLTHGLALPERYKRTPGCFIAEDVADAGLKPEPTIATSDLAAFLDLTQPHDMPDEVRAKLHKALALAHQRDALALDPSADQALASQIPATLAHALTHAERALALDPRSGVKKLIEQLASQLKKARPSEPPA